METERRITDLHGKSIVVYDTEIQKEIGQDISWRDYDKMGISVACVFDYRTGDNSVYLEKDLKALGEHLRSADLIVGFNIKGFDNNLLLANGINIMDKRMYDELEEVRIGMGWRGGNYPKGCKLDEVLKATFGMQKTSNGEEAPRMYQRGEMGTLISYCLADVRRERMVLESAYANGFVSTPTHGKHTMRSPI